MKKSNYGHGVVSRKRGRYRVIVPRQGEPRATIGPFDDYDAAVRVKNAYNVQRHYIAREVGTRLCQWGDAWLHSIRDHKAIVSETKPTHARDEALRELS